MVVVDLEALDHVFSQHAFGKQIAEKGGSFHPTRINLPQLSLSRFFIAGMLNDRLRVGARSEIDVAVIEGEEALAVLNPVRWPTGTSPSRIFKTRASAIRWLLVVLHW